MKRAYVVALITIAVVVTAVVLVSTLFGRRISEPDRRDDPKVQIRSPHFVDSSPEHRQSLAAAPTNVVINTNFDLYKGSRISVKVAGKEVATGDTTIDAGNLAMRRSLDPGAPDGTYLVKYRACWPDKSCHDGRFSFVVDRERKSEYEDMTGNPTVTIEMSQLRFKPARVVVSQGTRIDFVNRDDPVHFVNTDPHPSHTYYPPMNSRGIKTGAVYSITLDRPGEYPYHCSAHFDRGMTGRIIVEP